MSVGHYQSRRLFGLIKIKYLYGFASLRGCLVELNTYICMGLQASEVVWLNNIYIFTKIGQPLKFLGLKIQIYFFFVGLPTSEVVWFNNTCIFI